MDTYDIFEALFFVTAASMPPLLLSFACPFLFLEGICNPPDEAFGVSPDWEAPFDGWLRS